MAHRANIIHRIGLALVLSASTIAASPSFGSEAQQACMGDAFRFCSSEIPNVDKIIVCMRKNRSSLTEGCRSFMDKQDAAAKKNKVAATQ
jgi:hypothetical protein